MAITSLGYDLNKQPIAQSFFVDETNGVYATKVQLFFYVLVTPVALIRRLFNRVFSKNKSKSLYMKSVVSYRNFNFKDQF